MSIDKSSKLSSAPRRHSRLSSKTDMTAGEIAQCCRNEVAAGYLHLSVLRTPASCGAKRGQNVHYGPKERR
jgi:hypothetical protein